MDSIATKLKKIDENLDGAVSNGKIKLIAVSKYASDAQIIEAYNAGLRLFGENYVLPGLERQSRLNNELAEVEWHLLGPIQSNKINKAVGNFKLIQSVGSLETAHLINSRAEKLAQTQEILLQINSTGDKNGFSPENLKKDFAEIKNMCNLKIRGLMTMGFYQDAKKNETIFEQTRQLKKELESSQSISLAELSMGMSDDYKLASQYGSTMIRLGRVLFDD
jgi:pyridoxal phosphate enzyme (YggS family)